jgi:hypothetical protein
MRQSTRAHRDARFLSVQDKAMSNAAMVAMLRRGHRGGMTSTISDRLSPRSLPFVLVAILVAFLLLLAVGGFFDPLGAAHGFGIDLAAPADAFYLHVKGDRDLALALTLLALLVYRRPAPLALFVAAACIAPVIDASLVASDPRGHVGYALAVHGSAAAYGIVTAALLWRAARNGASERRIGHTP